MPFFDYRCADCGHTFEVLHKIADPAPTACPSCGEPRLEKLLTAPAVQTSSGGGGHVHGPNCRH